MYYTVYMREACWQILAMHFWEEETAAAVEAVVVMLQPMAFYNLPGEKRIEFHFDFFVRTQTSQSFTSRKNAQYRFWRALNHGCFFGGVGALGMHPFRPHMHASMRRGPTVEEAGGRMETPQRGGDKPRPPLISRLNFEKYQNAKK